MTSSPPRVEERAIEADRHESWLGLRSVLEHATEEGDALAPAGTHQGIVNSLLSEPRNSPEAVAWLLDRMSQGSTPVKLKCLMLVEHLFTSGQDELRHLLRDEFEAPVNELRRYRKVDLVPDGVAPEYPSKLVRRWATDLTEIFHDDDLEDLPVIRAEELTNLEFTIIREPRQPSLSMRIESTHDDEPIITDLPLRVDTGDEGAAERNGIIRGMIIKSCSIGGDPAHGVPGRDVQPVTGEHVRHSIREAIQADEHLFILNVQTPLPGWRRSVKRRAVGSHVKEAEQQVGDPSRNLQGVQCSWCFQPTTHVCVAPGKISRDVCVCQSCFRQTVKCKNFVSNACNGTARHHQSGSDSECALCMGLVQTWLDAPVWPEHWCSWCFQRTPHELVEKKRIGRSLHRCSKCGKSTQKCCEDTPAGRPGQSAMSRAGDDRCFKCEGLIEDWDEPGNQARFEKMANCSWCFQECVHTLVSRHSVKRNRYQCSSCSMETACCGGDGCNGMVRAGGILSTDARCVSCNQQETWLALREKADEQFNRQLSPYDIEQELARPSKYKQLAWTHGCVRVFLLIVSMPSATRNRVACLLGWTTVTKPNFGDAHAEAYEIVNEMMACTNEALESLNPVGRNCNYYDMLYRVGVHAMPDIKHELERRFKCKTWDDSLARCQDGSDPHLRMMEDMLIYKMSQVNRSRMNAEQRAAMDQARDEKNAEYIKYAAQMSGCVADDRVKQYALDSVMVVYYGNAVLMGNTLIIGTIGTALTTTGTAAGLTVGAAITSAAFGTVVIVGGVAMLVGSIAKHTFGSEIAKLHPVIYAVLSQRLSLLIMGMEVENHFPKQYGKDVSLRSALGDASDSSVIMKRKSTNAGERVQLAEKFEQMQMSALKDGVENRIQQAEEVVDSVIVPEALGVLQAAQRNDELVRAGAELSSKATSLLQKNDGVELVKDVIATPEQKVEASQLVNAGQVAVGQIIAEAQAMSEAEKQELAQTATSALAEVKALAVAESEVARRLLEKVDETYASVDDGTNTDTSALLSQGKSLLEQSRDPVEFYQKLKENEGMLTNLKRTCLKVLEDTITGVELPTITGVKDWGTYSVNGLAVKGLAVTPEKLSHHVDHAVALQVTDVSIEFDEFDWAYNKTTFPSLSDQGKAATTVVDLRITVSFEMSTNANGRLVVSDVRAGVNMAALNCEILDADTGRARMWVMNKLLAIFADRLKDLVLDELRSALADQLPLLREQIGALFSGVGERIAPKAKGTYYAVTATAFRGDGDEIEMEPEPELLEPEPEPQPELESAPSIRPLTPHLMASVEDDDDDDLATFPPVVTMPQVEKPHLNEGVAEAATEVGEEAADRLVHTSGKDATSPPVLSKLQLEKPHLHDAVLDVGSEGSEDGNCAIRTPGREAPAVFTEL